MSDVPVTIVIPISVHDAANKIAFVLNAEPGGEHTFDRCRLSASGQEPATHVAASGLICDDTLPLLSDSAALYALLVPLAAQRERECPTLAEVELAVGSADLSPNSDPFAIFSARGLQVVEVPV